MGMQGGKTISPGQNTSGQTPVSSGNLPLWDKIEIDLSEIKATLEIVSQRIRSLLP